MIKVKKEGSVMLKTNNSTTGNRRSNGKISLDVVKEKPFMAPKVDSEAQGEELHWMAFAAYNQSK